MEKAKLKKILSDHKKWLHNMGGKRADFGCADLNGANLRGIDLTEAIFSHANLVNVNFSSASLDKAILNNAILIGANLFGASLCGADLSGSDLSRANLRDAFLNKANLHHTNLCGADLKGANLNCSNVSNANFSYTIDGNICRLDFGEWSICIRQKFTTIGCKTHSNKDWLQWTPQSKEIKNMHTCAPRWWRTYGPAVKAAIRVVQKKEKNNEEN